MYDHGYRAVKGISNLNRCWRKRMDEAYKSGAEKHPLRSKHKGTTSYTDKFEAQHPGVIRKLFRYAQRAIGN